MTRRVAPIDGCADGEPRAVAGGSRRLCHPPEAGQTARLADPSVVGHQSKPAGPLVRRFTTSCGLHPWRPLKKRDRIAYADADVIRLASSVLEAKVSIGYALNN